MATYLARVKVESLVSDYCLSVAFRTIPSPTGTLSPLDWREATKTQPHLRCLEGQLHAVKRPFVDLILGTDHPTVHASLEEKFAPGGKGPDAWRGPLGGQ